MESLAESKIPLEIIKLSRGSTLFSMFAMTEKLKPETPPPSTSEMRQLIAAARFLGSAAAAAAAASKGHMRRWWMGGERDSREVVLREKWAAVEMSTALAAAQTAIDDDDDLDDGDQAKDLNTSHLVLAQFDKVTRTKSRWKCTLKDGIMHINNKDILFNKVRFAFRKEFDQFWFICSSLTKLRI
ncbi:transcription factor IIA large subunit family protein [Striga asiatica]|uniref:Transcription factor IIA large subunit family protein n=1 Tax=Striga asiatica TaxID=4170 RepID=A0A5A7PZ34_STRAF|nr:transcription factor IIA large subunit family protein [Striga asiatica]